MPDITEIAEGFDVDVERLGRVRLYGEGPWTVQQIGRGSFSIADSKLRPARPSLEIKLSGGSGGGRKWNQNVSWASGSIPRAIVAAANAELEASNG